jgi:hypothetical protein
MSGDESHRFMRGDAEAPLNVIANRLQADLFAKRRAYGLEKFGSDGNPIFFQQNR